MNNHLRKITLLSLLSASFVATTTQGFAQDKPKDKAVVEKKESPKGDQKQSLVPFNGKIAVVDKTAKTIKVGERTFQITSETILKKGGKPATLDDAVVGDVVGGNYQKSADGKLNAKTVRLGPKPEAEAVAKGKGDAQKEKK